MSLVLKSELIESGSGNWTIPTGCVFIWVTMCGGGAGGGGGCQSSTWNNPGGYEYAAGGGGGGAESVVNAPVPFRPTDTVIAYAVGAGGLGGASGSDTDAQPGEDGGETSFGGIKCSGGYAMYLLGSTYNNAYIIGGTDAAFGPSCDGGGIFGGDGTSIGAQNGNPPDNPRATFWCGGASSGSGGRGASNSGSGGDTCRFIRGIRGSYNNNQNTGGAGGGASHFGPGGDGATGASCDTPSAPSGYGGGGAGGASRRIAAGEPGNGGDGAGGFILICWIERQ